MNRAEFVRSAASPEAFIRDSLPRIVFAGKSNVGKSSVINRLLNRKNFARVGSQPGKTMHVNYFKIDGRCWFVDLPGYGFAKAPKTEQQKWGQLMENYLSSGRVTHIFLLLDIRHAPTAEDKQMFQWILYYGVPFTLVATKADKLAKSKRAQAANAAAKLLGAPPAALAYSSETGDGRQMLLDTMGNIVKDHISLHNPKTPIDIDTSLLHNME